MGKAYSNDLRERVLRAIERGMSAIAIARKFEVTRQWVYQVKKRFEETGERGSFPMGGHYKSRIAHIEGEIRCWIAQQGDITLREMCDKLREEKNILIDVSNLWRRLKKWGITYKKKPAGYRTRSAGYQRSQKRVERKSKHHAGKSPTLSR